MAVKTTFNCDSQFVCPHWAPGDRLRSSLVRLSVVSGGDGETKLHLWWRLVRQNCQYLGYKLTKTKPTLDSKSPSDTVELLSLWITLSLQIREGKAVILPIIYPNLSIWPLWPRLVSKIWENRVCSDLQTSDPLCLMINKFGILIDQNCILSGTFSYMTYL